MGFAALFFTSSPSGEVAPIFVSQEAMTDGVGNLFPGTLADYWWFLYTDVSRIDAARAASLARNLNLLEAELSVPLPRISVFTVLENVLLDFQQKLLFSSIPVYLLIVQVVGIVLYYIVMVGTILVERQVGEITLLRSRGATVPQVLGIYLMEGLLIAGVGVLLGPWLAAIGVALLGRMAVFEAVSGGRLLPVMISSRAYGMALIGGILGMAAMVLPVYKASRGGVVEHKRTISRPEETGWYHKYFVDIFMVIVGGIIYWEVVQRGGLVGGRILGGISVDQLLLLGPVVLVVGVSLVFLRIFPLALRAIGTLVGERVGVSGVLALWRMGRDPGHYERLVLLLMLGASLGVFTASFSGTLEKSYRERALYASGADLRLSDIRSGDSSPAPQLVAAYQGVPGVQEVTPALRTTATLSASGLSQEFQVLAVDDSSVARVLWYREDFSKSSPQNLSFLLRKPEAKPRGRQLPGEPASIGMWVKPSRPYDSVSLWLNLADAEGNILSVRLGVMSFDQWRYLEEGIPSAHYGTPPAYPLTLLSVTTTEPEFGVGVGPGGIYLDDLQVMEGAKTTIIEDFEDIPEWGVLANSPLAQDRLETSQRVFYGGKTAGAFSWSSSIGQKARGIFLKGSEESIPILASSSFLSATSHRLGDSFLLSVSGQFLPVQIKEVVRYFPTMDPSPPGFVIIGLDTLTDYLNLFPLTSQVVPNEVLLSLKDAPALRKQVPASLKDRGLLKGTLVRGDSLLEDLRSDPLLASGIQGLIFVVLIGSLVLTLSGYVVYSLLSSIKATLQFAVVRAMGFSARQIVTYLLVEQLSIVIAALIGGVWLGARIAELTIRFLEHTEQGKVLLPPFILQVNWLSASLFAFVMFLGIFATIALLSWTFSRLGLSRVLRGAEE